jgi:Fe-S oxidoreductase
VNVFEATVRLVPSPPHRTLVVLGYPSLFAAADHVPELLTHEPIGLEGFNDVLTANMEVKGRLRDERARLPEGGAWLLAEFGGWSAEEPRDRARAALAAVERHGGPHLEARLLESPEDQAGAWAVRESAVGDSRAPGALEAEGNWEDAAVHPAVLGAYLRDFDRLVAEHGYQCVYYGHFGQGCVHTRLDFELSTAEGTRRFRSFMESAADLVLAYGGSLAGEYGEGQGRSELLPRMFGPELMDAFREFKAIWDPDGMMNPDRLIDAPPFDANLRLGVDHRPPALRTEFAFPRDAGSFAGAVERCFGMGKCRDPQPGDTMCPSFGATREEKHTTRGRARLLFEMLEGEVITGGWRSDEVRESLDLCLACKGCKTDCPTQTDLASLKAEFLSHHYRGRLRPRSAYALGLFPWWARAAARAPRLANAATRAPVLGDGFKRLAGVAPERELPLLAPRTFRDWFDARGRSANPDGRRVVLWPDTFTNHLEPEVARAAVEVLEAHGMAVELPPAGLCCGRPLYDFGMLTLARRTLWRILDALAEPLRAGVPVVGLEPSCVAVFRDELVEMLPDDDDAHRLRGQTYTLSELLAREVDLSGAGRLERRALVQAHCHHRAVMGLDADRRVLDALGLALDGLEVACCGMAGSFGYEREKYETSMRIGERGILPAVRDAADDTLILADGFSCRSQIAHATGRRPLHLAEAVRMGMTNAEESL